MFVDFLRLALSNLRRRKLRAWLTMLGIFIGIAAVVSLISLGQGMEKAIAEQFFQLGADKIQVVAKGPGTGPPGSNSDVQLTESDLQVIRRANGVVAAAGRLIEPIRVEFNDDEIFTYTASLPEDPDERALVSSIANVQEDDIIAGRKLDPGDQWKVMFSEDYITDPKFDGKALSVGDKITIDGQDVEVVGVFKKTGNPFVDLSFVMNEEPIRQLLDIPQKYGVLAAQAGQGENITLVAENIRKDLRNHRNLDEGDEDFNVNSATDVQDAFGTILNVVTGVLVGIAGISMLVGAIGITNTMYTAVLERRKEIGIMKAIGARNSDILSIFLIESGFLGLVGGAIGVFIGIVLSKIVETAATIALGTTLIQANFPWYLIVFSLLGSFLIGSLAGTLPALQASKLPPVEALRQ